MDRLQLYRIFVHVADTSSFTRTADALAIPRSTVSTAILNLEARVGAQLLNRTTRRVAVTQEGLAFYERCRRIIEEVDEAEGLFRSTSKELSGTVRVDVPSRIGRLLISPALPDFMRRHPHLRVEMGASDRAVSLVEESVDCALRVGALEESSLVARQLGALRLINVASPAYLKRRGTPMSPADLENHEAVIYASPTSGRAAIWEWTDDARTRSVEVQGRVTVNNAECYIACCLAGLGLIQIPAYDVRAHLASGRLVQVMPDHHAAPMPVAILYPHRRHLSRRVRGFIDWLAELMVEPLAA